MDGSVINILFLAVLMPLLKYLLQGNQQGHIQLAQPWFVSLTNKNAPKRVLIHRSEYHDVMQEGTYHGIVKLSTKKMTFNDLVGL